MQKIEQELIRARERHDRVRVNAEHELAKAAKRAQGRGLPVRRIGELLGFQTRQGVYDLWGRTGLVALIALVVALAASGLTTAAAEARTTLVSDHPHYQRWVNQARVPTPDVTLRVVSSSCPYLDAPGCTYGDGDTIWMRDGRGARIRLLHELGHHFDARVLTDDDRARMMALLGVSGDWRAPDAEWWDRPEEIFADAYMDCARRVWRRGAWRFARRDLSHPPMRVCDEIRIAYYT